MSKKYFDKARAHKHREMDFYGEPILVKLYSQKKFTAELDAFSAMSEDDKPKWLAAQFVDPVELTPAFTEQELNSDDFSRSDAELLASMFVEANITADQKKS